MVWKRTRTAHVVVHKPDVYAFAYLSLEYFKNTIPHHAFLHDKIFHENIPLGFFKLNFKLLEKVHAHWEILRFCLVVNRKHTGIANIVRLPLYVFVLLSDFANDPAVLTEQLIRALIYLFCPPPHFPAQLPLAEKQIQ